MTTQVHKLKQFVSLAFLLLAIALGAPVALADENPTVFASFSVANLGQRAIWGGGPLYTDGTAQGEVTFVRVNGQLIFQTHLETWSSVAPDVAVICGSVDVIRNPQGLFVPSSLCFPPLAVTQTPQFLDLDNDGTADVIVRLTAAG